MDKKRPRKSFQFLTALLMVALKGIAPKWSKYCQNQAAKDVLFTGLAFKKYLYIFNFYNFKQEICSLALQIKVACSLHYVDLHFWHMWIFKGNVLIILI